MVLECERLSIKTERGDQHADKSLIGWLTLLGKTPQQLRPITSSVVLSVGLECLEYVGIGKATVRCSCQQRLQCRNCALAVEALSIYRLGFLPNCLSCYHIWWIWKKFISRVNVYLHVAKLSEFSLETKTPLIRTTSRYFNDLLKIYFIFQSVLSKFNCW
jgi:hypothetical protein